MNLDKYLTIDINLFSIMVVSVLIIANYLKAYRNQHSVRLFLFLCWSALIVLVLDTVSWIYIGSSGVLARYGNYTFNFLYLIFNPLPAIMWVCYIDFLINKSISRLRKRWFYLQPMIPVFVLMVLNFFNGWVFYVDDANMYHRNWGMAFPIIVDYALIAYAFLMVFIRRKTTERRLYSTVVMFSIIPAIGASLQLGHFGLILIWPSVTIAILFAFSFLEVNRNTRDYLTGLFTRQQIDEMVYFRIAEYERTGPFSLIMIDMDNFKLINDTLGHWVGDEALADISRLISRTIKRSDIAARFGGDEFLVLLDSGDPEVLNQVIERLRMETEKENLKGDNLYTLEFSAGGCIYEPDRHLTFTDLMNDADRLMYAEKNRHRKQKSPD